VTPGPLATHAVDSRWVAAEPGLHQAIDDWEAEVGSARAALSEQATELARPGLVPPGRALRHATAMGLSRLIRIPTRLPSDLRDLTFLRDPEGWARSTGIEAFADQLALGGAATAEVARLIVSARGLFPAEIVDEIARRKIAAPDLELARVEQIAARSFADLDHLHSPPLVSIPTSQLHTGVLVGGRRVGVRVRRPAVARQLAADARLSAGMAAPVGQLLPQLGGMGPLGFVQLITRQGLESVDLRYEALSLVELGLVVEAAGVEGLTVARPVPGHATRYALACELPEGRPAGGAGPVPDPTVALASLISLTLEPALTHGVFWADPSPDHLLVTPDGGLALIGVGAAGRLTPQLRRAGIRFLTSVVSGDAEGQVEAMQLAGAVPPGADLGALMDDLRSAETLQVHNILMGGEAGLLGGLRDATRILLAHQLQPPLDVVLLLRTVFALGETAERIAPGAGGLMAGLLPLFQRLPDLIAAAEAAEGP
jgi:ubiquinone biosynthesis protein